MPVGFKASKTLSGIETALQSAIQANAGSFKASKTLSGIETASTPTVNIGTAPNASKPLKPFQGLKLASGAASLVLGAMICFKASKTLSGIETSQEGKDLPSN